LAPDHRFQKQNELLGKHGAAPLTVTSLDSSRPDRSHSITSVRAPGDQARCDRAIVAPSADVVQFEVLKGVSWQRVSAAPRARRVPLSPNSGPLRGAAKPGVEIPYSRAADHRDLSTGVLLSPEFCGAPPHRVIELVQQVEPGGKKRVAPLKRSCRCSFSMARPGPHGGQNSPR
jgi:hypothetical protein